jgi:glutathione-regulated potassium-efflux system ancillary protein KefG
VTIAAALRDMPRPVVDLGEGKPKLWLRPEIERWNASRRYAARDAKRARR